jgi:hypothetical protein
MADLNSDMLGFAGVGASGSTMAMRYGLPMIAVLLERMENVGILTVSTRAGGFSLCKLLGIQLLRRTIPTSGREYNARKLRRKEFYIVRFTPAVTGNVEPVLSVKTTSMGNAGVKLATTSGMILAFSSEARTVVVSLS